VRYGIVERPPCLGAGILVECNDARVWLAADGEDEQVRLDQRGRFGAGKVPQSVFPGQILLPKYVAFQSIQTDYVTGHSQGVYIFRVDDWCGRRQLSRRGRTPILVGVVCVFRIGNVGRIDPNALPGRLCKTEDMLLTLGQAPIAIGDVDPIVRDHGTGIAPPDRHTPTDFEPSGGDGFEHARLVPDAIAV
jgi:hypothetical protein